MSTVTQPISPPPPAWRRWVWTSAGVVVVVLALVAAFVLVPAVVSAAKRCADGVRQEPPRGECVGVTDGSFLFDPALATVETLIRDENRSVLASNDAYVSLVVMLPMTLSADDEVTVAWVQHQLEGAVVAQREANRGFWLGNTPKIRVLLANPGSGLQQWRPAVQEIERERTDQRIVAVTGIGLSLNTAVDAIHGLIDAGIPVFGSTLTADDIGSIRGFARVSPTNSEQAQAAAQYLDRQGKQRAVLVEDQEPSDHYPSTLANAFRDQFTELGHTVIGPETYLSRTAGADNLLSQMGAQICGFHPDVIYFAGRAREARVLIQALAGRPCPEQKYTVMTGDDLSLRGVGDDTIKGALGNGVEVLFTGLAHPAAWTAIPQAFDGTVVADFTDRGPDPVHPCDRCFKDLFPTESLDDGVAIIGHDAVAAAAAVVRKALGQNSLTVSAEEVAQFLKLMNNRYAIGGASGKISFDPENGNPKDKPIPILRLLPGQSPKFVELICPSGTTSCMKLD
ncbi:ABC transporter substrate-binding protein [Nocardia macrotermitis]|uniref:Leucine-binding protein domain-containing protein n=1 Tax=Nocardia macrotermitis TaxID=2585198 RepID=A0A7K0D0A3_9NOCA|nr:ABC transporter substrate-binding protein [Nocardia macrotermitis]MQY18652.1 hypothetical protein [Nocardia macrotermitis]